MVSIRHIIMISISALLICNVHCFAPGNNNQNIHVDQPKLNSNPRTHISAVKSNNILPSESSLIGDLDSRRSFMQQLIAGTAASSLGMLLSPMQSTAEDIIPPFHSAAYGLKEYTNSIVASRDTNISPKEVYDTISSDFLTEAFNAAIKDNGNKYIPRALDVGAGAGVSTEVLYTLGYKNIEALDWSGSAWEKYVIDDPSGYCPRGVNFYESDDERYLDRWREKDNGLFDVIVFNFAVNESKAALFAKELLDKNHGRLLAPINTSNDYWLKQTYMVMDSKGEVLWSAVDVGAWSVQFQPDVTQDTVSGQLFNFLHLLCL